MSETITDDILRMVFAFDASDSRRDEVRAIAKRVQEVLASERAARQRAEGELSELRAITDKLSAIPGVYQFAPLALACVVFAVFECATRGRSPRRRAETS